jgi:hypothetical protein
MSMWIMRIIFMTMWIKLSFYVLMNNINHGCPSECGRRVCFTTRRIETDVSILWATSLFYDQVYRDGRVNLVNEWLLLFNVK